MLFQISIAKRKQLFTSLYWATVRNTISFNLLSLRCVLNVKLNRYGGESKHFMDSLIDRNEEIKVANVSVGKSVSLRTGKLPQTSRRTRLDVGRQPPNKATGDFPVKMSESVPSVVA